MNNDLRTLTGSEVTAKFIVDLEDGPFSEETRFVKCKVLGWEFQDEDNKNDVNVPYRFKLSLQNLEPLPKELCEEDLWEVDIENIYSKDCDYI